MPSKVWDEITCPFPNFNGASVEVGMDKQFHPTLDNGCTYLSVLELTLIHVNKMGSQEAHFRKTINLTSIEFRAWMNNYILIDCISSLP